MKSTILKNILIALSMWFSATSLCAQILLEGTTQETPIEIKTDSTFV